MGKLIILRRQLREPEPQESLSELFDRLRDMVAAERKNNEIPAALSSAEYLNEGHRFWVYTGWLSMHAASHLYQIHTRWIRELNNRTDPLSDIRRLHNGTRVLIWRSEGNYIVNGEPNFAVVMNGQIVERP